MRFAQERRDGAIKNKYIKINNKRGMRGTFATRYVEVYLISSSLREEARNAAGIGPPPPHRLPAQRLLAPWAGRQVARAKNM